MNILIFHTGSLGDTLVSVPALWAIRERFREDWITLLCDMQVGKNYIEANEVLEGSGLIDDWMNYSVKNNKSIRCRLHQALSIGNLFLKLRQKRFHAIAYLVHSGKSRIVIERDLAFFRLAGIHHFIGHRGFFLLPKNQYSGPLPEIPHRTEQILARLSLSGIPVPHSGQGKMELNISDVDRKGVETWLGPLPCDGGRPWIGIGPGSKMPAKLWPTERYEAVISRLIRLHDVWPVVFGGPEDQSHGIEMLQRWGRGYVAAGFLNIRQGIAALQRCHLYLGNDTGTMHMAVVAGIRCVAIFSSRDYPGHWYPYGKNHMVFRTPIECERCMLEICTEKRNACLLAISVDEVFEAVEKVLMEVQSKISRER